MVSKSESKAVEVRKDWSSVSSWEDAVAEFGGPNGITNAAEAFGDGSELLQKDALVGKEFMVLDWSYVTDLDTGREYVNVLVINRQGQKARFNDGSTGVYRQCKDYEDRYGGKQGGIYCPKGLRVSEYTTEVDGKSQKARTFYFS